MVLYFADRGCALQPGKGLFVYLVGFGFNKIVVVQKNKTRGRGLSRNIYSLRENSKTVLSKGDNFYQINVYLIRDNYQQSSFIADNVSPMR